MAADDIVGAAFLDSTDPHARIDAPFSITTLDAT
jgi:hypothetical protein